MAHQIRIFGDPVLKKPCVPVESFDQALKHLADDMIETMYGYKGVGVAGPQVGVSKAIFVWDEHDGKGPFVAVNPELVETTGTWQYEEGCLSVPNLFFPIQRADTVVMKAYDLKGEPFTVQGSELLGRILQHEYDHLQGTLLISRLDPADRKRAMSEMRKRAVIGN